jgi:hypothetical protein
MLSFIKKYILNPHLFTFYLDEGGGQPSQPTSQNVTQTSIPEYARPYVERTLGKAEALTNSEYQAYGEDRDRIAGFTPMQQQAQQSMANLGPAQQLGTATQMAGLAGLNAANINYQGGDFANQYQRPAGYQSGAFGATNLQQFQMGPAERARTQSFIGPGTAEAYMSPYQQAVTDIEKREATRASDITGQQQQARAVQQGAFGGSRSAIVEAERQRNLGQQLGDIQARGGQASFQQAQQQFNAEQQARLQAQLANQQAGLTVGGQNLSALLGVQQLGAGQSMEAQRLGEQSRQFGYGQDMTAAQLGAQYGTEAQRMAEQSRQFGANLGLQGLQASTQAASTLGQLGQTQFGQQKDVIQGQASAGAQQQELEQQRLSQDYQDFLNQRQHPYQQLAFMSDMYRGLPLSQYSQTMYQQPESTAAKLGGAAMTYMGGRQAGYFADGGLTNLALYNMSEG